MNERFGTWRGLVRLWLAWAELAVGRLRRFQRPDLGAVERLVWVCAGNVCRSPYAEFIARELGAPSTSCGLSTSSGQPAFGDALTAAARAGADLSAHRSTAWADLSPQPGDLYIVMEVRQARELVRRFAGREVQVTLLGLWSRPRRPHIHDPMTLSADYFDTCFRFIASGTEGLVTAWRSARYTTDADRDYRKARISMNQRSESIGSGSANSKTK